MPTLIEPMLVEHVFVVGLVIVGLFAVLRGQPQAQRTTFDTATRISTYWINAGLLLVAAAILPVALWLFAGRGVSNLGLTHGTFNPAAIGLTLFFLAGYSLEAWWRFRSSRREQSLRRLQRDVPFLPTTGRELVHFCVLALAAAVGEEILFRGYLIQYVGSWTGTSTPGLFLALAVPALAFGLVHRYQGWRLVAWITVLSLVFGGIFLVTGSLLIPIVLHFLMDVAGGLFALRFLRSLESDDESGEGAAVQTAEVGGAS